MVFSFLGLSLFLKYLKITNLRVKEELNCRYCARDAQGKLFCRLSLWRQKAVAGQQACGLMSQIV
jgi:hypothetical protein